MLDKEAIQELAQAEAIGAADEAVARAVNSESGLTALPSDFKIKDLEKHMGCRRRQRGHMLTSVVADFADYVKAAKENGAAVFVNPDHMQAVAVLNLGDPEFPGHCDNLATLKVKATAAYAALVKHTGGALIQKMAAEFLEDWEGFVECFHDGEKLTPPQAIAAIRKITIEGLKRIESEDKQLSASRSTLESITAKSDGMLLPTHIYFRTVPYLGLQERLFVMRLGVLTGSEKPQLVLRVINQEKHAEEMAAELAEVVRAVIKDDVPVMIGTYAAAA